MNRQKTLKSLELILESFLDRAVGQKGKRLTVLEGLNRLDDIARLSSENQKMADEIGNWFAEHNDWLKDDVIRPADANRISGILKDISEELSISKGSSHERLKISTEINRWRTKLDEEPKEKLTSLQKLILKRGPEAIEEPEKDTIGKFSDQLNSISQLWEGASAGRPHVLSVLDDCLKSAYLQKNEEALLLSGFIIYYLRQKNYLVEPYVKRLKAAESLIKKGKSGD